MNQTEHFNQQPRLLSRYWLVLAVFVVGIGYFLWAEHEAHVKLAIPYLPYLIVLACPLMHLFMHRGHGSHGRGRHDRGQGDAP